MMLALLFHGLLVRLARFPVVCWLPLISTPPLFPPSLAGSSPPPILPCRICRHQIQFFFLLRRRRQGNLGDGLDALSPAG